MAKQNQEIIKECDDLKIFFTLKPQSV